MCGVGSSYGPGSGGAFAGKLTLPPDTYEYGVGYDNISKNAIGTFIRNSTNTFYIFTPNGGQVLPVELLYEGSGVTVSTRLRETSTLNSRVSHLSNGYGMGATTSTSKDNTSGYFSLKIVSNN